MIHSEKWINFMASENIDRIKPTEITALNFEIRHMLF